MTYCISSPLLNIIGIGIGNYYWYTRSLLNNVTIKLIGVNFIDILLKYINKII